MSDNVTPLHPDREKKPQRLNRKRLLVITAAVCVLILVIALVVVAVQNELTDFGAVKRYFRYRNQSSDEDFGTYSYDAHNANRFAAYDEGLVTGSVSGLQLLDDYGAEIYRYNANLSAPAAKGEGKFALVYDIGGSTLVLAHATRGELLALSDEEDLLDADLTASGAFCYIRSEGNYKSVIPVYNSRQEKIFVWYSASAFYHQCALSPDADTLAAVCIGQQSAVFQSTLTLHDTSSESEMPRASVPLGDQLIYELDYISDSVLCAWGENGLIFVSEDGEELGRYEPAGRLERAELGADGFAAVWLESSLAGEQATVESVASNGNVKGSASFESEILDLAACGKYIAVLTANRLRIYNEKMELYAELTETGGATQVYLRADGSAILAASGSAVLYIP